MKKDEIVNNEIRLAIKTDKICRGKALDAKALKERIEERKRLGLS